MKLYFQYGYGMKKLVKELLTDWGGGCGAILSPRDLTEKQLVEVSKIVRTHNSEVLVDPQCYTRNANHRILTSHSYWSVIADNSIGAFTGGSGTNDLIRSLVELNQTVNANRMILPSCLADEIDEDWEDIHQAVINAALDRYDRARLIQTVALSSSVMNDETMIEAVVEIVGQWDVPAIYIVPEAPGSYLVDSEGWLANLLLLVSGIKLYGKEVIVGYANHQDLALAVANVDIIASGHWLNVRAFGPGKFNEREEGSISRRSTWYYCPQAYSEYPLTALDIALRSGSLNNMRSTLQTNNNYAAPLFSGAQPTVIDWPESHSFKNYLSCLRSQALCAKKNTFDETYQSYENSIDAAQAVLRQLRGVGVLGRDRDFWNYLDVNRSAIICLANARGRRLRDNWS